MHDHFEDCKVNMIHEDTVKKVLAAMPGDSTLYDLSEIFKVLGDPTRIKILTALSVNEMCGCDLAALLHVTTSAISHQLRLLKSARLVKFRKDGKVVYYSLDDHHVGEIFNMGLEHVSERK